MKYYRGIDFLYLNYINSRKLPRTMITETTPTGADLAKIEIDTDGMITKHNYPCPVCQKTHAVLNASIGVFKPCYQCQAEGFHLIKFNFKSRWSSFLYWLIK